MRYPDWYEKFYSNSMKALLWLQYNPADEREVGLFQKAYKRAFIALFLCVVLLSEAAQYLPIKLVDFGQALFISIIIAYIAGGTAFANQDIQLKKISFFGYWFGMIMTAMALLLWLQATDFI